MRKRRLEMGEEAWAEYQRERKAKKAMAWKAKNVQRVVDCRRRAKQKLIAYKGGKCEVCGYNKDCPSCYDFHHPDPTQKSFGISAKGITRKFSELKAEVDKCQLLCKNCHGEIHEREYLQQREETKKRYLDWLKKYDKGREQ